MSVDGWCQRDEARSSAPGPGGGDGVPGGSPRGRPGWIGSRRRVAQPNFGRFDPGRECPGTLQATGEWAGDLDPPRAPARVQVEPEVSGGPVLVCPGGERE